MILVGAGLLTCSVVGLVNIWAIQSQESRLVRFVAVASIIAVPLLIAGWDLTFVFVVQSICFWGLVILLNRCLTIRASSPPKADRQSRNDDATRSKPATGGLISACTGIFLVASFLFFMPTEIWASWVYLVAFGLALGVSTLLAYLAVFIAESKVPRFAVAVLLPITAPMVVFLSMLTAARNFGKSYQEASSEEGEEMSTTRRTCSCLMPTVATICGVVIFAPPAILFLAIMPRVWSVPTKTVNAKGYDFLIAEGKKLHDVVPEDNTDIAALRTFLSKYHQLLDAVRSKLCDFEDALAPQPTYNAVTKANSFRQLQKAILVLESVAEREKRTVDAAEICLDMVRLGQTVARGGDVFDLLLGITIESAGLQRLHGLMDHLSVGEQRRFACMLENVIEHQEPLERVVERDWGWGSRPFLWRGYVVAAIAKITDYEPPPRRNLRDQYYIFRAKEQLTVERLRGGTM